MKQEMVNIFSHNKIEEASKEELEQLLKEYKYSRAKLWDRGLSADWHTTIINKIYNKINK